MNHFRLPALFAAFAFATVAIPVAATLSAQVGPDRTAGGLPPAQRRAELERAFRQRTAEIVRRQLKLDDNQMTRLQAANQDFDRQRSALVADERQTRQALRAELLAGDEANQKKVATLVDQMLRFQRRRLDIQESEQRELGKFLTPVQRAKYFGLQAQLRKRMMELRDKAGAGPARPQMDRQMPRPGLRPMTRRPFR